MNKMFLKPIHLYLLKFHHLFFSFFLKNIFLINLDKGYKGGSFSLLIRNEEGIDDSKSKNGMNSPTTNPK
jgi:hypothetical protein